jgi:hypothetical protein
MYTPPAPCVFSHRFILQAQGCLFDVEMTKRKFSLVESVVKKNQIDANAVSKAYYDKSAVKRNLLLDKTLACLTMFLRRMSQKVSQKLGQGHNT